jgi:hypothetical protein
VNMAEGGVLEWREDVAEFCPRNLIEALVVPGRRELLPGTEQGYRAGWI